VFFRGDIAFCGGKNNSIINFKKLDLVSSFGWAGIKYKKIIPSTFKITIR